MNIIFASSLLPLLLLVVAIVVGGTLSSAEFTAPETDFSFVSDVEVTWRGRSSIARMFVDEMTRECRLVTPNLTTILVSRGAAEAQVQMCDEGAFSAKNKKIADLDEESRVLVRVCGVLSWPGKSEWAEKTWTPKQITRVPVQTNKDTKCSLSSQEKEAAPCDCTCEYAFDDDNWVGESRKALRAVIIQGCPASCGLQEAYVNVMSYWRTSIPPSMLVESCQVPTMGFGNPRDRWGSLLRQSGFPELPSEFSALFKVSLVEYGVNIEFHETFSAPLRAARTTVFTAKETLAADIATAETFLTHGTAGVTFRVQHKVVGASTSTLEAMDSYSCEQMVYKSDIFASSVEALLMVPAPFPPVALGNYTVRGVRCELWSMRVSEDLQIDWYFPSPEHVTAATGNSEHERPSGIAGRDKVLPRRIVLRGQGRSPFFTNHPFVPASITLPNGDTDYCDRIPFFYNPHCLSNAESGILSKNQYEHVIDIAELPSAAARNLTVFASPSVCIGAGLVHGTVCDGVAPGAVIALSLVCMLAGVAIARCMCSGARAANDEEHKLRMAEFNASSSSPSGASAAAESVARGGRFAESAAGIERPTPIPLPTTRA